MPADAAGASRTTRTGSLLIAGSLIPMILSGCNEPKMAEDRTFPSLIQPRASNGTQEDNERFAREWMALADRNKARLQAFREAPAVRDYQKTTEDMPRVHMLVNLFVWGFGALLVASACFAVCKITAARRRRRAIDRNEAS